MNVWKDASEEIWHYRTTAVLNGPNTGKTAVLQNTSERTKGRLCVGRLCECPTHFPF